ncbi:hypothetical protein TNCV_3542541 [Trichonephila clavipes]|nr:hypothetical protein TNCV_3542541 [Trichonephila clavipes]
MPPQTRTPRPPYANANDVRGMIAASPLSPDEYAMRIATTQAGSALVSVKVLVPIHCLSNSGVSDTTEGGIRYSDGRALKVHTVQGVVQRPPCSLLATVKRDIGRQAPVSCV